MRLPARYALALSVTRQPSFIGTILAISRMPIVGTVEHSNDPRLLGWNARRNVTVYDHSRLAGLENNRLTDARF